MTKVLMMMKQMTSSILRLNSSKPAFFPSNYVSRVSFTSGSRFYQSRYPSEDATGDNESTARHRIREAQQVYEDNEEADRVVEDIKQKAKDTARSINERAKEGAHQAGDAMHDTKERAKEGAHQAGDAMHDTKERVKARAHETKEKTKDTMSWAADKTKEGASKAAEAVQNVGEKAKGAWETAKDATHKIKETVVGEDDDDRYKARPEDYIEDRMPKRPPFDVGNKDRTMHRGGP